LDVAEVSTYRQQVRIKPIALSEIAELELQSRVPGAAFHRITATLNLDPGRITGAELPGWIESALLRAVGEPEEPVARMPA
jgi:hypothetical protein